jgi:hypothetical protein
MPRIDTLEQWKTLHGRPGHHSVARTETVKFAIDLQDDCRTYFINSAKWVTHYEFILRYINPSADYKLFLIAEYKRDDRRFILGSITHYLDGDHWTLELDAGDNLRGERMAWMYRHIAPRFAAASDLRFRPASPAQIELAEQLGDQLPSLSRDAINAAVQYQPVVLGVAYGYLRLVEGALDVSAVHPYDVVVIDQVPVEIPPVAALVTGQLQAPLAHVAILSRNRNTPDMAVRGAVDLHRFRELKGELVKLSVASQDYTLERADRVVAETAWRALRPRASIRPESDLATTGLFDVAALPSGAVRYVGAKTAQVGELSALPGILTPGGFALPFSAYAAHMASAGLDAEIAAMLADHEFLEDAAARGRRLSHLRAVIMEHPLDPVLIADLGRKLRCCGEDCRFIFRSSTNAEDLRGFNGAGLYESLIVPENATSEQVADTLRRVWASVWLQRAFEEREWYRIDHRAVAMAVLVQPFVDSAVATGVAITGNPFSAGNKGVFINSQVRGGTVTGAVGNELPEQYLVATWTGTYAPDLLCRSSLTGGAVILSATDVSNLTDQLLRIHSAMLPPHAGCANAMDVEFALMPDRSFVMLQARPYTIVYSLDRAHSRQHDRIAYRVARKARKLLHRYAGFPPQHALKSSGTSS